MHITIYYPTRLEVSFPSTLVGNHTVILQRLFAITADMEINVLPLSLPPINCGDLVKLDDQWYLCEEFGWRDLTEGTVIDFRQAVKDVNNYVIWRMTYGASWFDNYPPKNP